MADYYWPTSGLTPFAGEMWLQPHTGRSQSPLTNAHKTYGLSGDLWRCRWQIRGGYAGATGLTGIGLAMDALLARLAGGQSRVGLWDFRRPDAIGIDASDVGNPATSQGATSMTLTGLPPGGTVYAGNYIGGDGRIHIIKEDVVVGVGGTAVVTFKPALNADLLEDTVVFGNPLGWFRLTSDEAGRNPVQVGDAVVYDLEFIEDPLFAPAVEPTATLRIGGIVILIGGEDVEF